MTAAFLPAVFVCSLMVLFLVAHSLSKLTSGCNRAARLPKSHLRPDHMPSDDVPAEAEVVAAGRIDAALQQRGNGFRTGKAAGGVLVVAIGEIPEQVVAAAIDERQLFFRQRVHALCREKIIVA